jgi:hypothetical protein
MNARFFVDGIGRFASADTIVPDPINPQSFNRYSYSGNPVKYQDPSGHEAYCYDIAGESCDQWMYDAIEILRAEGGDDGARLAALFDQWANDPTVLLAIYAIGESNSRASITMAPASDDWLADIKIGKDVISRQNRKEIALLGHELEHLSQGAWLAWSIQGEVLAYQVEYAIRESMGVGQHNKTTGALTGGDAGGPLDPYNYYDLLEARRTFLDTPRYNQPWEPNVPWNNLSFHGANALNRASASATAVYDFMARGVQNAGSLVTDIGNWLFS